ncbi:MAG: 3TM-type holin [Pseudomonadota bacterium]|nr:3TM-type holin [Pseudomonadota bacterium]
MIPALIPAIAGLISKVIDRAVPDQAEAAKLRGVMLETLHSEGMAELEAQSKIILAEAQGESWLQRNWRPVLMLVIVAIIANNYLIAPYVNAIFGAGSVPTLELPERLWDLMTLGVGGYVAGRSAEKLMQTWKGS